MTLLKRLKCLFGHPPLRKWKEIGCESYIMEDMLILKCPRCGKEEQCPESEILR